MSDNKYGNARANQEKYPFVLPNLPYDLDDLEMHLSTDTLNVHHGKHHNAYVHNLNTLIKDTALDSQSLEEIIIATATDPTKAKIFNNAAQVWNHSFYWHCMKPEAGKEPTGILADQINKDFGNFEKFREQFKEAATTQFGSGWAWLVLDHNKLKVIKTSNADLPLIHNQTAILTCDVWEHAYYLDYQNRRPDYVTTFIEKLVNWDFAEENLKKSM